MKVKLIILIMGLFLTGCSEFTVKENTGSVNNFV